MGSGNYFIIINIVSITNSACFGPQNFGTKLLPAVCFLEGKHYAVMRIRIFRLVLKCALIMSQGCVGIAHRTLGFCSEEAYFGIASKGFNKDAGSDGGS